MQGRARSHGMSRKQTPWASNGRDPSFKPSRTCSSASPKRWERCTSRPSRRCLNNQEERLETYTEMVGLRRFVWHGDAPDAPKRRFIEEPCQLLMTTPESLEVMLLSPRIPVPKLFRELRIVIVDEVHALAGTDRGTHLRG